MSPHNIENLVRYRSELSLNNNLIGRMIAAIAMGAIFGSYIHYDYVRWGQRGREAFLAYQTQRFDQYMANPRPAIATVFGAIIAIVGALAIYEGLVFVLATVLKGMSGSATNQ